MTSAMTAGLALYDMVKAVDRHATITDVRLERKSVDAAASGPSMTAQPAAVITARIGRPRGRADDSGELLVRLLTEGTRGAASAVVPDDVDCDSRGRADRDSPLAPASC